MADHRYTVPSEFAANAHINSERYQTMYKSSVETPDVFWKQQAEQFLRWEKPFTQVLDFDFRRGHTRWFGDGELNVTINCIDRHLPQRASQTAIIWEGDNPAESQFITYQQLHDEVCQLANVLKQRGVKKGDRVCIYMPMIPQAAYAMLACARIGAVHSVVFGGFSPEALKDRILDSDCRVVITADEGIRGGKHIPLKDNTDKALEHCPNVHTVLTVKRTGGNIAWNAQRDIWYHDAIKNAEKNCTAEIMNSEDPLFILYTSGSTGKPKGVLHTTAGYLLHAAMTFKYTFDYHEGEVF